MHEGGWASGERGGDGEAEWHAAALAGQPAGPPKPNWLVWALVVVMAVVVLTGGGVLLIWWLGYYPLHEQDDVPETPPHEAAVRYARDAIAARFPDWFVTGNACIIAHQRAPGSRATPAISVPRSCSW